MRLMYKVKSNDSAEINVENDFCKYIRTMIRNDLRKVPKEKLNAYADLFLETTAIDWVNKPKTINMVTVMNIILNGIVCEKTRKRIYTIRFSDKLFPNTYNSIDYIVRFLDKGNEEFPAMHIFAPIFMKYEMCINDCWKYFLIQKLHRVTLSKVLVFK